MHPRGTASAQSWRMLLKPKDKMHQRYLLLLLCEEKYELCIMWCLELASWDRNRLRDSQQCVTFRIAAYNYCSLASCYKAWHQCVRKQVSPAWGFDATPLQLFCIVRWFYNKEKFIFQKHAFSYLLKGNWVRQCGFSIVLAQTVWSISLCSWWPGSNECLMTCCPGILLLINKSE